jgi:hypothetical protein
LIGKDCRKEDIDAIMAWGDEDHDGKISYKEFLTAFRRQTVSAATQVTKLEQLSSNGSEILIGLDAKIPGGRYDSNLSPSLQEQVKRAS